MDNKITSIGINRLLRSTLVMPDPNMRQLKEFCLCIFFLIEPRTVLAVMEPNFLLRQNSLYFKFCKFVIIHESLGSCQLGSEGIKNLAKGNWPELTSLSIGN